MGIKKEALNKKSKKIKAANDFYIKIICILLIVALLCGFIYTIIMSFSITNKDVINYKETGNVDYKIYLKDNSFYDAPYLEQGMAYIASLIDNININYTYKIDVDRESNLDIKYKLIAKLIIASQTNSKVFLEKEYDLAKEVIDEMVDKKQYFINKNVEIDYAYYNNLANSFKSNYAVNTNSYLEVYLDISEVNKENNSYEINSGNKLVLTIPLSQQEVNIKLDNSNINSLKQITNESKIVIKSEKHFVLGLILLLSIFAVIAFFMSKFSIKNKISRYDKYVNRLLRGYDRIIVNITTLPNLDDYNVINVQNFQELIDVRDNTKEPINYYVVTEHSKCVFFVLNQSNLYLYAINEKDLDGEVGNEKK